MISRSLLTDTITVWNIIENEPNKAARYQRTVLAGVRYLQQKKKAVVASGIVARDAIEIYISLQHTEATSGRRYIDSAEFDELADKTGYWTLADGRDFVGLGTQTATKPSTGGKGKRKDWKVDGVAVKRALDARKYIRVTAE